MFKYLQSKINFDENLKYIFRSGGISLVYKILGIFFGFLIIWLISRLFNESYYGTFTLLQVTVQLLTLVLTLGLQNITILEINKNPKNTTFPYNFYLEILKKIFVIGIIFSIVLYVFSGFISNYLFLKSNLEWGFKIMGISFLFYLWHELSLYFFVGKKDFVKFGFFMFFLPNLLFVLYLLVFKSFITTEIDIFGFYSLAFVTTFFIEFSVIYREKMEVVKLNLNWKELFNNSLPIMLNNVTLFLIANTSVLILGRLETTAQIGIFNAANKIGLAGLVIIAAVNVIISPKVAHLYHENQLEELKKFIHQTTRTIALITLPITFVIILFHAQLLSLFGIEFMEGSYVLIIISISTFINALSGNVDQILYMTGHQRILLKINILSFIISVAANLLLIKFYGINGAAVAILLATLFLNVAANVIIKRKLGYFTLW